MLRDELSCKPQRRHKRPASNDFTGPDAAVPSNITTRKALLQRFCKASCMKAIISITLRIQIPVSHTLFLQRKDNLCSENGRFLWPFWRKRRFNGYGAANQICWSHHLTSIWSISPSHELLLIKPPFVSFLARFSPASLSPCLHPRPFWRVNGLAARFICREWSMLSLLGKVPHFFLRRI